MSGRRGKEPAEAVPALRHGRPRGTSSTPSTVKWPLPSRSRAEPPPPRSTCSTVPCIHTARRHSGARPVSVRLSRHVPPAPRPAARSCAASTFSGGLAASPAMAPLRGAEGRKADCGARPLRKRKGGRERAGEGPGPPEGSTAAARAPAVPAQMADWERCTTWRAGPVLRRAAAGRAAAARCASPFGSVRAGLLCVLEIKPQQTNHSCKRWLGGLDGGRLFSALCNLTEALFKSVSACWRSAGRPWLRDVVAQSAGSLQLRGPKAFGSRVDAAGRRSC